MTGDIFRYWAAHQAAAECQKALAEQGISVHVTVDPCEVLESIAQVGKPYLTPLLDPNANDFTESNYFWLIASRGGEPLIVGGGRLDKFGSAGDVYLGRSLNRAYGAGTVAAVNPEVANGLSGRVCYLGDLYSRSAKGLSRKNVGYFLGVANFISAVHFKADCTYSFMRIADVRRGSADVNGFDRRIFQAVTWGQIPPQRSDAEMVVFRSSKDDAAYFRSIIGELAPREAELTAARDDPRQASQA